MSDEKVLEILRAISHPTRLEILRRIQGMQTESGVTCSSVLDGMEISQSTFSHHISELSHTGLVVPRAQGRCSLLTVDRDLWNEFQACLGKSIFDN